MHVPYRFGRKHGHGRFSKGEKGVSLHRNSQQTRGGRIPHLFVPGRQNHVINPRSHTEGGIAYGIAPSGAAILYPGTWNIG